jgi:hypothetical protein
VLSGLLLLRVKASAVPSTEHDATVTHHILATGCFLNELTSSLV